MAEEKKKDPRSVSVKIKHEIYNKVKKVVDASNQKIGGFFEKAAIEKIKTDKLK